MRPHCAALLAVAALCTGCASVAIPRLRAPENSMCQELLAAPSPTAIAPRAGRWSSAAGRSSRAT